MRLILFHPELIHLSCKECATKLYNIETGRPQTYRSGPDRVETFYYNQPTPCKQGVDCPKESPEHEHEYVLTEQNRQCYLLYRRVRAGLQIELDELAADNFASLDSLTREYERNATAIDMQRIMRKRQ